MGGSLAVVLAVGGTQLADAALTALTDITLGVGSLALLCTVLFVALCLVATHGQQQPLTLAVVDDAEVGPCPWCHTRECIDKTLCNCAVPCGSWLCEVKEASR